MKQLVEDWMTKHPLKIDVNEDVEVAGEIMNDESVSHMIVTDEGSLVGIISKKDLANIGKIRGKFKGLDCLNVKISAGDIMGRNPATISSRATMTEAIRLMNEKGFHSLPVEDEYNRLRGILTSTDVLKYALVASQRSDFNLSYAKLSRGF